MAIIDQPQDLTFCQSSVKLNRLAIFLPPPFVSPCNICNLYRQVVPKEVKKEGMKEVNERKKKRRSLRFAPPIPSSPSPSASALPGIFSQKIFRPAYAVFLFQKNFSEAFLRNRQDHIDDDRHNRLAGGGDVALIRFFVCGGGRCFLGSDRMTARPHSRLQILEHLFLENPLHYMILRTMRTASEYPLFVKIITLSCSMLSILNYCENNHSLHGVIVNRLTIAYICI